ncbi:MAG: chromosome partitioning protein ParB, partial [Candidatus Nanopelagicales bacterium]
MAEAKRGLGRGLGALIPTEPASTPAGAGKGKAGKVKAAAPKRVGDSAEPPRSGDLDPIVGAVYVEVAPDDVVP